MKSAGFDCAGSNEIVACARSSETSTELTPLNAVITLRTLLTQPPQVMPPIFNVDADGNRETLTASMILSGVGAFNKPRMPNVPGMDRFEGPSVHTARYPDEGLDLTDKRVVLVGNSGGATAQENWQLYVNQAYTSTTALSFTVWNQSGSGSVVASSPVQFSVFAIGW